MSRSLNASRDPNAPWYHLDPLVALAAVALAGLGIASIYSSTRGTDPLDYNTFYLERQTLFVVIGIGMGTVAALVDYQRLRLLAPFLYALSLVLLIAVLSPLGSEVNGAQANTAMGDAFPQQASVKSPVDQEPIAEGHGVLSQHPFFESFHRVAARGYRLAVFDESPVRLAPGRVLQTIGDMKFTPWGAEDPRTSTG